MAPSPFPVAIRSERSPATEETPVSPMTMDPPIKVGEMSCVFPNPVTNKVQIGGLPHVPKETGRIWPGLASGEMSTTTWRIGTSIDGGMAVGPTGGS